MEALLIEPGPRQAREAAGGRSRQIHKAPNRVRYVMNGFVIAVGSFVAPLFDQAMSVAKQIGAVQVDVGDTSCKVPLATEYLAKIKKMGRIGKKRKTAFC